MGYSTSLTYTVRGEDTDSNDPVVTVGEDREGMEMVEVIITLSGDADPIRFTLSTEQADLVAHHMIDVVDALCGNDEDTADPEDELDPPTPIHGLP